MVNPEIENYIDSQNYDSYIPPVSDTNRTMSTKQVCGDDNNALRKPNPNSMETFSTSYMNPMVCFGPTYWTDFPPMDTPLPSTVNPFPWVAYPASREPHVRKAALAFLLAVAEEYDISRSETNDDGDPTPLAIAMKELEEALGT